MRSAWARSLPSMSLLYRSVLFFTWCLFKVCYRHKVYMSASIYKKSALIAANHVSYCDPPLLAISWPEDVHFLAKEELFRPFLFGNFIRSLNAHPVSGDATDIGVFKTICKLLHEGKKVILFPEGQRNTQDALGPLKSGIAVLVGRSGSAVIPAYIHGTFGVWGKGRSFPRLWGRTACVFGSAIEWQSFAHLDKKAAQHAFMERLQEAMEGLRAWYLAGAQGTPP